MAAALCRLLKLALERWLIDLPCQKGWQQRCLWGNLEMEEMRATNGLVGRLVDADRVEACTFRDKQHVARLEPIRLLSTSECSARDAGPRHSMFGVNVLHLNSQGIRVGGLLDGAAEGVAALNNSERPKI